MATFLVNQKPTASQLNAIVDKIMNTPTSTSSAGTATSGTTETRDDVLSIYTFTAGSSRRYRVTVAGLLLSAATNDLAIVTVRDGGSISPTSGSVLVALSQWKCQLSGGGGQTVCPVSGTFTPSAGTRTLALFTKLAVGTGPVTPIGARELYVEDIGAA